MRTRLLLLRWSLRRGGEKAAQWLAWRLPRWLVYWAAIRLGAQATTGPHGGTDPGELPFMEALKRWWDASQLQQP